MDIIGIYCIGMGVVFGFNYISELLSIERCFQKAVLWPFLLVKSIIKGIRNEL